MRLCGLAVVELEHTAKPRAASHRTCSDAGCLGRDEFIAQTLMRPFLTIVIDKRSDGGSEMSLAEWHDSRQALRSDGSDKPLRKRVQIRTPGGQEQWFRTTVPQEAPKGSGVERVTVQNQVLNAAEETVIDVGQVPCHLRHPRARPADS